MESDELRSSVRRIEESLGRLDRLMDGLYGAGILRGVKAPVAEAEHDRALQEKAWSEGASWGALRKPVTWEQIVAENPYRKEKP